MGLVCGGRILEVLHPSTEILNAGSSFIKMKEREQIHSNYFSTLGFDHLFELFLKYVENSDLRG